MTILKSKLISTAAAETETTQVHAALMLKSITDQIEFALRTGEDVRIAGFGTFSLKQTPARTGRNPKTGATLEIPAKRKVVFKPAADFTAGFN